MDPNTRLRLATRIHFALLRHVGASVDVSGLLQGSDEGREALWVCYAADDPELRSLAAQFAFASAPDATASGPSLPVDGAAAATAYAAGHATGHAEFAASRPLPTSSPGADPADAAPSRWPNPLAWLRRRPDRADR